MLLRTPITQVSLLQPRQAQGHAEVGSKCWGQHRKPSLPSGPIMSLDSDAAPFRFAVGRIFQAPCHTAPHFQDGSVGERPPLASSFGVHLWGDPTAISQAQSARAPPRRSTRLGTGQAPSPQLPTPNSSGGTNHLRTRGNITQHPRPGPWRRKRRDRAHRATRVSARPQLVRPQRPEFLDIC